MEPQLPPKKNRWIWSQLAANTGASAISTMLPIYIIQLGGTVLNVALLNTLYNGLVLPAQLLWGVITDRLGRRRLFFLVNNIGSVLAYLLMFLFANITSLTLAYGFLGIVLAANTASSSLLVMETSEKGYWSSSFVAFSTAGNTGGIIGIAAGALWSSFFPLRDFFLFALVTSVIALFLTLLFVPEPLVPLETSQLFLNPAALAARIYHGVADRLQLSHVPSAAFEAPGRVFRIFRSSEDLGRKYLFLSMFLYMTGQTVQTTSFTPFLLAYGVKGNEVFGVTLASNVLQTAGYRWMSANGAREGAEKLAGFAIVARAILFLAVALSTFLLMGLNLFFFSVIVNGLIGVTWTLWNPPLNVMLFSSLGKERRGGIIGGYSAVSTLGLILGALISGAISYRVGYAATFVTSSALCLASLFVLQASLKWLPLQRRVSRP